MSGVAQVHPTQLWVVGMVAHAAESMSMAAGLTRNALGDDLVRRPGTVVPRPLSGDLVVVGIRRIQPRDMDDVFEPSLEDGARHREPLPTFGGVVEPTAR